jgi:hypothetical protein
MVVFFRGFLKVPEVPGVLKVPGVPKVMTTSVSFRLQGALNPFEFQIPKFLPYTVTNLIIT